MAYIHQLQGWPMFKWNSDQIAPLLARLRYSQGLFAQRCKGMNAKAQKEAATTVLISDAVASSALEGVKLSARELAKNLRKGSAARIGLLEVLLQIQAEPNALLTATRLFNWHQLIAGTGENSGKWRGSELGPKEIIFGPLGWENIQYVAPVAARLPEEMQTFLAWFNFNTLPQATEKASALWDDPIIKAAIAHFWFISIHPFNDGSARLARAIGNLALLRADEGKRYYSLDERILQEKTLYLKALTASQSGDLDITPWLEWFLHALERTVQNADALIASAKKHDKALDKIERSALNPRQSTVLGMMLDDDAKQISTGSYAKISGCSTDTALRDIQELLKLGLLRKNKAGGRSTSYSLKI